jgi:amino acid transporter
MMTALPRKLRLSQAIGLSISMMAPTAAMALNLSLVAQTVGRAAPPAFAIGTAVMAIVGLSFVAFSRRIAHAGSVYAYVARVFGRRCGLIAGWTLLLTYLAFAGGVSALVGSFLRAALQNLGLDLASLSIVFGVGACRDLLRQGRHPQQGRPFGSLAQAACRRSARHTYRQT